MDGIGAPNGPPPILSSSSVATTNNTTSSNHRARSTTLLGGLPPPSITGLRPIGRRSYNYLNATNYDLPQRGRPTTLNDWRGPRTSSENARGNVKHLLDEEYPDVQSWLRPTKFQLDHPHPTQKVSIP